jgi:DNA-binding transcriptional regulator YdaS (Cro superfamily)
MKLIEYVVHERGRLTRVARAVGIAPAFLAQIASGKRSAPVQYCRAIVGACGGAVALWDLRPNDWHLIWPELTSADGAPAATAIPAPQGNQPEETRDAA